MILNFRHRDSRSNQRYDGSINIAFSGYPSSLLSNAGGGGSGGVTGNITNNLQFVRLPINCALAGQQKEEKKGPDYIVDLHAILKKIIYRE